jgi:hypothetical protein
MVISRWKPLSRVLLRIPMSQSPVFGTARHRSISMIYNATIPAKVATVGHIMRMTVGFFSVFPIVLAGCRYIS